MDGAKFFSKLCHAPSFFPHCKPFKVGSTESVTTFGRVESRIKRPPVDRERRNRPLSISKQQRHED